MEDLKDIVFVFVFVFVVAEVEDDDEWTEVCLLVLCLSAVFDVLPVLAEEKEGEGERKGCDDGTECTWT